MSTEIHPPTYHAQPVTMEGHVSVVIVTWNHIRDLPICLEAILQQTYPKMDVCVVDNASQDGSPDWVQSHAPQVRLVRLDSNQGFSSAFNLGARMSNGEYVLSLNPDVRARPDFISQMIGQVQKDKSIGVAAPKLLRADDPKRLDSTGLFIDRRRRPYDRGQMEADCGQYDTAIDIFGACGAAGLYRRAMLEDVAWEGEYLDEDFFAYIEDVDLAWRARLRGWRSIYVPRAVADHVRGWGDTLRRNPLNKNSRGPRLSLRNRYLMLVKNDTFFNFMIDCPWIILSEIPRLVYMVLFRFYALAAVPDFFRLLRRAKRKRQDIKRRRLISDRDMRPWFTGKVGRPR